MKIPLLFILIYLVWHASARLKPVEVTTEATSTALSDVLKAFFVAPEEPFEVFILGNEVTSERDILGDALSKTGCVTTIKRITELSAINLRYNLPKSSVIMASLESLKPIIKKFIFRSMFPKELKMLIYTKTMKSFPVDDYLVDLGWRRKLDTFLYFLHEQQGKIELFTYEWFTRHACNRKVKATLSIFDTKTLAWSKPLSDHKKFRNFHGCQIIAVDRHGGQIRNDTVSGATFDILDAVGSRGNFTVYRQRGYSTFINFLKGIKLVPQIIIGFDPINSNFHSTVAIADEKISVTIREGELYSSYEKLLFPFDVTTWSLIVGTFCAAFGTILVVNRLPKRVQKLLYGEEIYFPAFNVLGTFFGIGQTHLPSANFPRIILMLFILFCLIIRTAYQGVFFEMMATDMRKPIPETIEELLEKNYTIYCANNSVTLSYVMRTIGREHQLEHALKLYELNDSRYVFTQDAQKVAMFSNAQDDTLFRYFYGQEPLKFKQPVITFFNALSTFPHHFMFPIIKEVVERTIPAGIPQHWFHFMRWDYLLRKVILKGEAELVSLTLEDLGFGFVLWLVACLLSLVVFAFEALMWRAVVKEWTKKWKIRDGKLRRKVRRKPQAILVREAEVNVEPNA